MTSAIIAIWITWGVFSFWPLAIVECDITKGKWYEWVGAWIIWTICWPYRYAMDAWYWWRAKK